MASNKCKGKLVTYECIADSHSWGKRNAQNQIFFPEDSYTNAIRYAPSNWRVLSIEDAHRTEELKIELDIK